MGQQHSGTHIGRRALISAGLILLVLMISAAILTRLVPAGEYRRIVQAGREALDPTSFRLMYVRPLPVWRWFTAPVEVLGSSDAIMVITTILFILLAVSLRFGPF